MRSLRHGYRLLGLALLILLAFLTALVALEPSWWWLLLYFLGLLWLYGFSLSHSHVLRNDSVGSPRP